jgi:hypothetical protein
MGIILSKLLGVFERYEQLINTITIEFRNEVSLHPIPFQKIKLRELDYIISQLDKSGKPKPIPRSERNNVRNLHLVIRKNEENMGEIINYKGYKVGIKDETIKRIIDTRENLMNQINNLFISSIFGKIRSLTTNEQRQFVFPVLSNELFNDIGDTNDFSKVNLIQYKSIKHQTIIYNRHLKTVQKLCNIDTPLSSHVSRHTFTNLLLRMDNVNLYDISQSLGHSGIKITENYLTSGFNVEKIDYLNNKVSTKYLVQ